MMICSSYKSINRVNAMLNHYIKDLWVWYFHIIRNMQPYNSLIALLNIPLQSQYLYNGHWSIHADAALIDIMLRLKEEIGWEGDDFPTHCMPLVAREMHDRCALPFTEVSLVIRLCFLAARRRTFREVISWKGTYWGRDEDFVYAADVVWVSLMQTYPFAAAYYYHGEPEYDRLCILFAPQTTHNEPTMSYDGQSSSTNDSSSSDDDDHMIVDVDGLEVMYRDTQPKVAVRRKLFVDHVENTSVAESSSAPTRFTLVEDNVRNIRRRVDLDDSSPSSGPEKAAMAGLKFLSPFGSSCASNSPCGVSPDCAKSGPPK